VCCTNSTRTDAHECRKRHWESSGRRFKSCQPDAVTGYFRTPRQPKSAPYPNVVPKPAFAEHQQQTTGQARWSGCRFAPWFRRYYRAQASPWRPTTRRGSRGVGPPEHAVDIEAMLSQYSLMAVGFLQPSLGGYNEQELAVSNALKRSAPLLLVNDSFFQTADVQRIILFVYPRRDYPSPILNLDHALTLHERGMRPTAVVERNRAASQKWALRIFQEANYNGDPLWCGVEWWSFHRPHWRVLALWGVVPVFVKVEQLDLTHAAVVDAADSLGRVI
jgi:hypothetical protein